MQKPMLPSLTDELPFGNDWLYEVKYDGFRVLLQWTNKRVELWSRNGNKLTSKFPEITEYCEKMKDKISPHLPLVLDGELVILNTPHQGNFALLQQRNRMGNRDRIAKEASNRPATVMCFDIIEFQGKDISKESYENRKKALEKLPFIEDGRLRPVTVYKNPEEIQEMVTLHLGEGIVAKRKKSKYSEGERTEQWLKWKNWRTVSGILSTYEPSNGYFSTKVYQEGKLKELGKFKHGLNSEDQQTLKQFFTSKGQKKGSLYSLQPSVCVDVNCLEIQKDDLREPMFEAFRFDLSPEDCTEQKKEWDLALFPDVTITNPDKVLWDGPGYQKRDLLLYLRRIAPYMLPFLKQKRLTVIRFPDGIMEESFFQKHVPDYAPEFVDTVEIAGEQYALCNHLSTLIWFGNQGSLEYHIPFETIQSDDPNEIVFDLDPPSIEAFPVAIHAATLLKHLCDQLSLTSFVKTSGGKGMQVHIPIKEGSLSYEETREFTEQIANLLVQQEPTLFTVERLKKNRGDKLYIDYVQHAEGKTIIAPYSPRGREQGTVATPLYWEEVKEGLHPSKFTIAHVVDRVEKHGCPFYHYRYAGEHQDLSHIRKLIKEG